MAWFKQEIESLYLDKGLSAIEIGKIKNCSERNIRYWMEKFGIPRRQYPEAQKLRYLKNPDKGRLKIDLKPSKDLAYILGVLLGDGWVSKKKGIGRYSGNYLIGLGVTSKEFAQNFREKLRKIGLNPFIYKRELNKQNPRWKDQYIVEGTSKEFYLWYKKLSLIDLKEIIGGFETDFIQGFYESEGSLGYRTKNNWRLNIYNSNKVIIDLVRRLMKKLRFKSSCYESKLEGKKTMYSINLLGGMKEVKRFLFLIKPVIKNLCG